MLAQGIGGGTVAGLVNTGYCHVGDTVLAAPGEEEYAIKGRRTSMI
jgi:hypothetical protein